ncbi:polysaccharide biosynthesis protein [Nostoc sp. CHAB 5844]|nr:polysaccharide biosynthesis protein [Nostoc sp. CHAB 5844]
MTKPIIYWFKILSKFISIQLLIQAIGLVSGFLLIRTLDKQQYAYFTIANTMQGTMDLLADSGVSISLTALGGKVWQDRYQFGQLINTAMQLRRYLAAIAIAIITPILLWMLISNGASVNYAICIVAAVLFGLNSQLTTGVLDVVPRLHSQINRIQTLDLLPAVFRLTALVAACFTFLNAAIAILIVSIAQMIKRFLLSHWVADTIETNAPVYQEYKNYIIKTIKHQAPNAVFYCVQGQLTIWLISIFGNTQSIAEIGALARLSLIFSLIGAVMNNIILPSFARCQSFDSLYRRYYQILGSFCLLGILLIGCAAIFPTQILLILGDKYIHLEKELVLMMVNTVFTSIVGTMWSLNATKGWIDYSWIEPPLRIGLQALLLMFINVSTVDGVINFGLISNFVPFLVNIFLTYRGFNTYQTKN